MIMNWLLTGHEILIDNTMTKANSEEATRKINEYKDKLCSRQDDPLLPGLSPSSIANPRNASQKLSESVRVYVQVVRARCERQTECQTRS